MSPQQEPVASAPTGRLRFATIVGAGPGGICAAIRLKQAGIDDFLIVERSGEAGGTWASSRYPGVSCDVPSALYSYSFEPKPDWSHKFAPGSEIKAYFQRCVESYGLADHLRLGTDLVAARWDPEASAWDLVARDGWTGRSSVLISAVGMFTRLRWPELPGLADFPGDVVHSGAWPEGGLDLADRDVAVIGTAASAVQLVPELAQQARTLYVHQRTPSWILPRGDESYDEVELAARRAASAESLAAVRNEIFEFFDRMITLDKPALLAELEVAALANLDVVQDADVRRRLRPTLPFGSQRPLFSDTFYPTFNRPHVSLVTEPIARVTRDEVVTCDGQRRKVDAIVLATGYEADRFLQVVDVTGRDGRSLREAWAGGAYAYKGMTVPGFPNLFMLYGPNTNNGSIVHMLEHQAGYIARKLAHMRAERIDRLEVRREVAEAYNARLQRDLDAVRPLQAVGSRYYRSSSGRIVTQWPHTMRRFGEVLAEEDIDAFALAPTPGDRGSR